MLLQIVFHLFLWLSKIFQGVYVCVWIHTHTHTPSSLSINLLMGILDGFRVLAIVNSAVMNIGGARVFLN